MNHSHGYRDSNPKIDLYVNGVYKCSTNYSVTCKDAVEFYRSNHPEVADARVTASIDNAR